ncbi:hypothetical protein [Alkalibacterium kapii]|uniref:Uncharacterized protein n=1 Tax=Alkalibacterium kapii TaxID=426704 RepID=A0A511ASL3_9LACT|nr:hypothetical protein [Alkalibacterium kapii]GEK91190.1 hypothetical protein AKA01nite_08120 [Alkalibacterium kapii]
MSNDMEIFQRMVQQFLDEHGDEFDTTAEAVDYFTRKYNNKINTGFDFSQSETKETRSMKKLEEAQYEASQARKKKLIKEAIEIWPENWDAQSMLIDVDQEIDMISFVEHTLFLEKRARKYWQNHTDKMGYLNVEERPYLRLKAKVGFLYMDMGMVDHALEHLLELYNIDQTDSLGTRYKIMSLYVRKFDWKSAWRFFQKAEGADEDDQLLLPILILAVLTDRKDLARSLLEKLINVNREIGLVLMDDMWPIEDIYNEEVTLTTSYQPFSYQSLLIALRDIVYVVVENAYLFDWLKKETFKRIPIEKSVRKNSQPFYGELDPFQTQKLEDFFYSMRDEPSNPLRGMRIDRMRILYHAGLRNFEDFAERTEKEILKLDGIGPVTIKELRANGVKFKK